MGEGREGDRKEGDTLEAGKNREGRRARKEGSGFHC